MGNDTFDAINRGRNWGLGFVAITRRIQRLSKDYFDLCQHLFLFKVGLKSREYVADMIGKAEVAKVMSLPQYHFLHYDVEREASNVHVLKLGRAVTEKEAEAQKVEGEEVKKGRIEEAKEEVKEGEQVPGESRAPTEHPSEGNISD